MTEKVLEMLKTLTDKERKALEEAISVIYLNDSSDYINGLWGVVTAIIGDRVNEEGFDIKDILHVLDPELVK